MNNAASEAIRHLTWGGSGLMNPRTLALRAAEWKMSQATAEVRQEMRRGLYPLRANGACVFLLSIWLVLGGIFRSFLGGSFEKYAFFYATCAALSKALEPVLAGLIVAVAARWTTHYFEHNLEHMTIEMKNVAAQTISDLARLPFVSGAATSVPGSGPVSLTDPTS